MTKKPNSRQKRSEGIAKKNLEDLFKPKSSPEEIKSWKNVKKNTGTAFSEAASEHVQKFGYPKDWNDLISLLDHGEESFVQSLLGHMQKIFPSQTDSKKEMFIGKLKVLLASCDDYKLSKMIQKMIDS